jgi:hypothetical protein
MLAVGRLFGTFGDKLHSALHGHINVGRIEEQIKHGLIVGESGKLVAGDERRSDAHVVKVQAIVIYTPD